MKRRYVVCGIVQRDGAIVLGQKPPGQPPYPDTWHLPGGKVDDTAKAAALFRHTDFDNPYLHEELRRELREELGIEVHNIRCVSPTQIPEPDQDEVRNKHGELTHYIFLAYFCDYASGTVQAASDLATIAWVKRGELHRYALTPPSQKLFHGLGWLAYTNPDGSVTSPLDHLALWPLMSTVAWQVAGPILVLGIGGALLDRRLRTGPAFLLLAVIASIAVSWVLVRGTVRRLQRQVEQSHATGVTKPK